MEKHYLCIDLKSFYASVECVDRGLDPMTTDLVVADPERSEKTICLAVSPSMKAKGVRNRCRVFEIPKDLNYIMAPPRMQRYIDYSADIYAIYLKYVAKEDIHVYSIDEVFMDVSSYFPLYQCSARELGERIRNDVLESTGIPASCGVGTNMFLAKVALDISAKHSADFFGELDEESFKETLWNHQPLSDFWRIGRRTQARLAKYGIETLAQLALYPYPEKLYAEFGIDAEILIDHAWSIEPVEMHHIKAYKSAAHSVSTAQVLPRAYSYAEGRVIAREMADAVHLDLLDRHLVCESITLTVGYEKDEYGFVPGHAHGSAHCGTLTNSKHALEMAALEIYDRCVERDLKLRRMRISANNVQEEGMGQMSLFDVPAGMEQAQVQAESAREGAVLDVKKRFGKNALVRGIDLLPEATQMERNRQIGGHKSGE
ncbi:MAG: DNA repair protein [Eggerthellaceae bacterium]|nr:DNA repair protein [Eggerthellaceae bacterium]